MVYKKFLFKNYQNTFTYFIKRTYKTEILPVGAKAFISGKWISATNDRVFEVKNKYSQELLHDVTNCGIEETQIATASAKQALHNWAFETTAKERGEILQRWYDILMQKEALFAELLTLEQGKPLAEAQGEIKYAASFLNWYAGEARRIYGQIISPPQLHRQHYHIRQPIGVVGIITPWNFPAAMITRKAAAALAAGCTLVIKPSGDTPLTALALAQASQEAGLPKGVLNVIPSSHENSSEIAKYFCESSDINCISFTGSTAVGKMLLKQAASTIKRVCLELGGNSPFVVFNSANINNAVQAAMIAKFRCSGQTCVAANRFYIQSTVYDEFVEKLSKAILKLKCGYGMDKNVTIGPLISKKAAEKVLALVNNAVEKGAKVVCGGKLQSENSTIFEPTILTDVSSDCAVSNEEIFGPIVALQKFETEEEVLKKVNKSSSGLAGYFFSKDLAQIYRFSSKLQVGIVGINEGLISCAEAAFGGIKESGLGREGAQQGIDEFTEWKYICLNTNV